MLYDYNDLCLDCLLTIGKCNTGALYMDIYLFTFARHNSSDCLFA